MRKNCLKILIRSVVGTLTSSGAIFLGQEPRELLYRVTLFVISYLNEPREVKGGQDDNSCSARARVPIIIIGYY